MVATSNSRPKRSPWAARVVISAGAAVALWAWSCDSGPQPRTPVVSPGLQAADQLSATDELRGSGGAERSVAQGDHGSPTRREILAEYWGEGWPKLEAELRAAGFDLEVQQALASWAEVEEDARMAVRLPEGHASEMAKNRMGWQEPLTNEWLVQSFGLDRALRNDELAELHDLARPYNIDLEELTTEYVSEIGSAVESAWESERYVRAPLVSGSDEAEGRGKTLLATSAMVSGWSVQLSLYEQDHPELVALGREISAVRSERNNLVVSYLSDR